MKKLEIKNPLKIIQVISKIAKIIATIVYACCIIGAIGCIVGLIILPSVRNIVIEEGKTIEAVILENSKMSVNSIIMYMIIGLIICVVNTYVAYITKKYFEKELKDGDPFTHSGADQLLKISLIQIISSILVSIVSAIILVIFRYLHSDIVDYEYINNISLDLGITLFILSLIFKYGANLKGNENEDTETDNVEKIDYTEIK